jgi:hypothetical protein
MMGSKTFATTVPEFDAITLPEDKGGEQWSREEHGRDAEDGDEQNQGENCKKRQKILDSRRRPEIRLFIVINPTGCFCRRSHTGRLSGI